MLRKRYLQAVNERLMEQLDPARTTVELWQWEDSTAELDHI
ncbi:hypothetical protein [Romeriopsis navalis]|nr:hypothetical protein [Romeriopsis navalis]